MIVYFADRQFTILGQASTELPKGLVVVDDSKVAEIDTGVAVFECKITYDDPIQAKTLTTPGNYILRSNGKESELFTITEREIDTKKQEIYLYAEDDGLDLLNEVVGSYVADQTYPIDHYITKYAAGAGFEIGINEAEGLTKKLSWDSESTASARIADIAAQFDGCEISYSFEVNGLNIVKKFINIYRERGKDYGIQLRLNNEIDSIITTESITNLATALQVTGGTPDNAEDRVTLLGYAYDDGDFYVDGTVLKSRSAFEKWRRLIIGSQEGGHITKQYSCDATTQSVLCEKAIAELTKMREMEVNYEVDITNFPDNVNLGDRVYIVDDAGELYISARVLKLEESVVDQEHKATLGEYLIKGSGIHQKVAELAEQFAKNSLSAARALVIANNANEAATNAQEQANSALDGAQTAQQVAEAAQQAANSASETASTAQEKATAAQSAVDKVEESVAGLETTVANAQAAAEQAQQAAQTAETKADEAQQAAVNAQAQADEAATQAGNAQAKADESITKADEAKTTAEQAIANAEAASTTAAAAKLDAENAQKDIDAFGENLTTLENTMTADYARKTDLTESEAHLQSQITQNANEISITNTKVTTIDETANIAAAQAQAAQTAAGAAQAKADQATADAQAAQTAADNAAAAATAAQNEADTAKAAAATAQSVADKAEADLEAAKADLATVTSRVDATEEEIVAAQQAVEAAQTAADNAQVEADAATKIATEAQSTADTAVTNAANAQSAANDAASKANLAQLTADEAKGDAAAAQAKADEAAETAAEAQRTANTAVTNAQAAQSAADQAAVDAAAAQKAADDADAKAAQAASDLATAQQNLANVTSRVDATEEEVAQAQQAVNTAQAAADKAKEEAEAAQATADTAQANAATAQTAADNAKAAADQAQADATAAQEAADKAQGDVDALAVRVTTAETEIVKNAEEIALRAKKTEVTETLGGYYTKEETDAAIQVKSDAITSTVSSTYATKQEVDDIEVGGRNLLTDTDFDGESKRYERLEGYTTEGGFHFVPTMQIESGTEYTLSAKIRGNANIVFYEINEGGNVSHYWIKRAELSETDYHQFSITFIVGESRVFQDAYICTQWGDANTLVGDWFEIEPNSLKLEKGNKVTDWTPAPEDVAGDISEAQNTADNAMTSIAAAETTIQQLADSIAALVRDGNGGSLIRQDSSGLWYFNIGEIEQNISDTANGLDDLSGIVLDANGKIDVLQSTAAALQERTEYVRSYTDENGQPCLELGEGDSVFKVRITNTEIQFAEDTDVPAKINRKRLEIEKAMIKSELQFGDDEVDGGVWIWKRRSNGNLGLSWKEVVS